MIPTGKLKEWMEYTESKEQWNADLTLRTGIMHLEATGDADVALFIVTPDNKAASAFLTIKEDTMLFVFPATNRVLEFTDAGMEDVYDRVMQEANEDGE